MISEAILIKIKYKLEVAMQFILLNNSALTSRSKHFLKLNSSLSFESWYRLVD